MKNDMDILQESITFNVMGVLWITKENLMEYPRPFHSLDYFFDGLLMNYHQHRQDYFSKDKNINFFISNHFDTFFFMGHVQWGQENPRQNLHKLLEHMQSFKKKKGPLLTLDFSDENLHEYLSSKYSAFDFKQILL